ncbi:MAG: protein translocase subunit SecD, partial [Stenotrophobium sp.]
MKPYSTWKYVLLAVVTLAGLIYATPNLYGEDPAVQITLASGDPLPADFGGTVTKALAGASITAKQSALENAQWIVRFNDETTQLKASDALKRELGNDYVVALNLASRTPNWLRAIGAKPMTLGLDLRGGVHFLLDVDIDDVKKKAVERYLNDLPAFLRKQDIRYTGRRAVGNAVVLEFADTGKLQA